MSEQFAPPNPNDRIPNSTVVAMGLEVNPAKYDMPELPELPDLSQEYQGPEWWNKTPTPDFEYKSVDTDISTIEATWSDEAKETETHVYKVGKYIGSHFVAKSDVVELSIIADDSKPTSTEAAVALIEQAKPVDATQQPIGAEAAKDLTLAEIVESLEKDKYVRIAPRLEAISSDTTRTNTIRHSVGYGASGGDDGYGNERLLSEQQSVQELSSFLAEVAALDTSVFSNTQKKLVERAADMLENVTYIGEKERQEAAKGIAALWKKQLRDNPKAQICVLTEISHSNRVKSDKFLLDTILGEFSDEDLDEFDGRIVNGMSQLTAEPEDAHIIMLDDWIISGSQMRSAYSIFSSSEQFAKYKDKLEIQLVTAPKNRIDKGLKVSTNGLGVDTYIPIRSYFVSHESDLDTEYTHKGHKAYESGSHSSVDYDFESTYIGPMLDLLDKNSDPAAERRTMPPTTRIIREYRKSPLANIRRLSRGARQSMTEVKVGV